MYSDVTEFTFYSFVQNQKAIFTKVFFTFFKKFFVSRVSHHFAIFIHVSSFVFHLQRSNASFLPGIEKTEYAINRPKLKNSYRIMSFFFTSNTKYLWVNQESTKCSMSNSCWVRTFPFFQKLYEVFIKE